ncbi:recombinase family protein [Cypionkella sp.]|uniref:recombinase family protein n=1 Tax=Cypionkella sp. TaxID=2811411 RepID=UPI002ABB828D|nr:recombinase family protein [Cypionkella sp.]MDZ4393384.1 recombinase family protein [Cypionkella sp.]
MIHQLDGRGEPIRDNREIAPHEVGVVSHIFAAYAKGISPKKIAEALNLEGIRGPLGGDLAHQRGMALRTWHRHFEQRALYW